MVSRRAKLKVGALLGSLLIGLVLAEWVIGPRLMPDVFLQRATRDGGVLVPYHPGAEADLLMDEFRVRFRINAHGHRDRLDRREQRGDLRRVLVLGDSFTVGWGVKHEETYAYRLEEALGIEFVNTAKAGGCPLLYVPQARAFVGRFKPDAVLVQLYDNDPEDSAGQRDRLGVVGERFVDLPPELQPRSGVGASASRFVRGLRLRHAWRSLRRKLRGAPVTRSPFVLPGARPDQPLLSRQQVITKHSVDLSPAGARYEHPASEPEPPVFSLHRALLAQLLDELALADVPVAVVYIPRQQVFLFERPLAEVARGSHDVRVAAEVCASRGVPFVNATLVLGAAPKPVELYFAHDGHLNAEGHAALAKALGAALPRELDVLR